jgi:hypothetical protein
MVEKYLLSEQEVDSGPFANDSEDVKSHELYPLVTNWWVKNQKEDKVKKTLVIWSGGLEGSEEKGGGPEGHSAGIERLKKLQTKLTDSGKKEFADTNVLSNFVGVVTSWLETNANNGAFITTKTDFGSGTTGKVVKILLKFLYFGNSSRGISDVKSFINRISVEGASVKSVEKVKVQNYLDKIQLEKSGKGYSPFTDENKIEALNYYKEKSLHQVSQNGKYSKKITNLTEAIEKATNISITKGDGSIEKGEVIPGGVTTTTSQLTWPNIDNPTPEEATIMNTMFGDDKSQLPTETKSKINDYVYKSIKGIVDSGYTIKTIYYGGYSSTSKVRTKFKGVKTDDQGKTTIIYDKNPSEANNEPLADARINSIESTLKTVIDNAIKNITVESEDIEISKGESIVLPNQGPGWVNYDPKSGLDSKYGGGYGPLYEKAKGDNDNLTPQAFYGNRSTEPLKQEYDDVYGPFRKNYGFVTIVAEIIEPTEEVIPSVKGKGGYVYKINWKTKSPPGKKKVRGNVGGGISTDGKVKNTTSCPKGSKGWWNKLNSGN